MNTTPFTAYPSHRQLEIERERIREIDIRQMFAEDLLRATSLSIDLDGLLFDFSKHRILPSTVDLFTAMAKESGLGEARDEYFGGGKINRTEDRAVLHTAVRNFRDGEHLFEGVDILQDVRRVRTRIKDFCQRVIDGEWKGATGKPIKTIVNIGIGGSDLGPGMVVEALAAQRNHLDVSFVSNVDGWQLHSVLEKCDPETTLFVVVSKTFTTQETMANAENARAWLINALGADATANHFVAVSTNIPGATVFGIGESNIFGFWNWVGGRFSLWSSVGLTIALACGYEAYEEMLRGAEEVDVHFESAEWNENVPFIMAMLGIWNNNYWGHKTHAILPYDQRLHRFPAYLQQADMESNGKNIDRNGNRVDHSTGPIIWGECGTNGQHAFYQLIHQGTQIIPCDFIAFAVPDHSFVDQHEKLLANCFAQSRALMLGRSYDEVPNKETRDGLDLAAFKVFEGNRPSSTLLFDRLTPRNLGRLIALYEHKIFVQGFLWNVFSYDQWGVELGKILANQMLDGADNEGSKNGLDASSSQLLRFVSVKS